MKALLKNGEWVEIETTYLFHDQYNTKDKRIFDKDIARIVDDVRLGLGKCRYCGAMVKRGEEHKHFEEQENKTCSGCFWYHDRLVSSTKQPATVERTTNENGETVTRKTVTTVSQYEKVCTYKEEHGECTHKECRRMGIDWFTPENTFFLKYPNGFDNIPEVDKLSNRGFMVDNRLLNAEYYKKIGSYTLTALLSYENGKATGIQAYRLYNCRRDYTFRFENGELFTDKYAFGWRKVKTLEGVPYSVMKAVKNICGR